MKDYYFNHEGLPFSLMIQGASHVLLDYKDPFLCRNCNAKKRAKVPE